MEHGKCFPYRGPSRVASRNLHTARAEAADHDEGGDSPLRLDWRGTKRRRPEHEGEPLVLLRRRRRSDLVAAASLGCAHRSRSRHGSPRRPARHRPAGQRGRLDGSPREGLRHRRPSSGRSTSEQSAARGPERPSKGPAGQHRHVAGRKTNRRRSAARVRTGRNPSEKQGQDRVGGFSPVRGPGGLAPGKGRAASMNREHQNPGCWMATDSPCQWTPSNDVRAADLRWPRSPVTLPVSVADRGLGCGGDFAFRNLRSEPAAAGRRHPVCAGG